MNEWRQWKINLFHAACIRKAILFGVGWWQYQDQPNAHSKRLIRLSLSRKGPHSVRDGYTEEKLRAMGFTNVINTGCPTMWPLADRKPGDIPSQKADTALLMLTDYHSKPELDARVVNLVLQRTRRCISGRRDEGTWNSLLHSAGS